MKHLLLYKKTLDEELGKFSNLKLEITGSEKPGGTERCLLLGKAQNSFVHGKLAWKSNDREALRNEEESVNKNKSVPAEAW